MLKFEYVFHLSSLHDILFAEQGVPQRTMKRVVLTKVGQPVREDARDQNPIPTPSPHKLRTRERQDYHSQETYCLCNQGEYGYMVRCSSRTCLNEWFHFMCVGLNRAPQGTWYCPLCLSDRRSATGKRSCNRRGSLTSKKRKPSTGIPDGLQARPNTPVSPPEGHIPPMVIIKSEILDEEEPIKEEYEEAPNWEGEYFEEETPDIKEELYALMQAESSKEPMEEVAHSDEDTPSADMTEECYTEEPLPFLEALQCICNYGS